MHTKFTPKLSSTPNVRDLVNPCDSRTKCELDHLKRLARHKRSLKYTKVETTFFYKDNTVRGVSIMKYSVVVRP